MGLGPDDLLVAGRAYKALATASSSSLGHALLRALSRIIIPHETRSFDPVVTPCSAAGVIGIPCESGRWYVYVEGQPRESISFGELFEELHRQGVLDRDSALMVNVTGPKAPGGTEPRNAWDRFIDRAESVGESVGTGVGDLAQGVGDTVAGAGGIARDVGAGVRGFGDAARSSGGIVGGLIILGVVGGGIYLLIKNPELAGRLLA